MPELIVHVGYPKCGSTLLQRHVFPQLDDVRHIAFQGEPELYQALALRTFPAGEAERKAVLSRFGDEVLAADRPTLISAEHFIMPAECFRSLEGHPLHHLDGMTILEQIAALPISVRVLILVRRQDDWLRSWYQERIKRYETRAFADFVLATENQILLEALAYDRTINILEDKFGSGSVHVVPFELLKLDSASFWRSIGALLPSAAAPADLPIVRMSMRRETIFLRRQSNRLLRCLARITGGRTPPDRVAFDVLKKLYAQESLVNRFSRPGPLRFDLPEGLADRFRTDNRALGVRLGTDLSELGYPC